VCYGFIRMLATVPGQRSHSRLYTVRLYAAPGSALRGLQEMYILFDYKAL
jgi:hypothetical protein